MTGRSRRTSSTAARVVGQNDYQIFLLTGPDAEGQRRGHVTLKTLLQHERSGVGSAWVRRQRYVAVAALQSAQRLSDLDQQ